MKKRILSALLALVMVLALLPATAFAVDYQTPSQALPSAVDNPAKPGENFYNDDGTKITTVTVQRAATSDPTTGREQGKWYWLDNKTDKDNPIYYEVVSGLVAGTSGSGLWYPSVTAYDKTTTTSDGTSTTKVNGAFTILSANALVDLQTYKDSSLTICLNGVAGANLSVPTVITSLKLTNGGNGWFPTTKGSVAAITTNRTSYDGGTDQTKTGLTITAEGVSFVSITTLGRANNLNLTNCDVGAISMDGTTVANAAGDKNNYNAQKVNMVGGSITGEVTLTGDGSTISLTGVTATDQDITVTSNGGSISVAGASVVGDITSTARTASGNYPSVTVTGGTVGNISRTPGAGAAASSNGIIINVSGGSTTAGDITADKGRNTIKVTNATVGAIHTSAGTLTIDGSYTKTGAITIDDTTDTSGMTLNVGSASTNLNIAGITSTSNKLKINSWPTSKDNYFGGLDLGNYGGHGVKGGTFAADGTDDFGTVPCLGWLDTNLQYRVRRAAGWVLYGRTELGQAICDLGTTSASSTNPPNIVILGQGATGFIKVMNGGTVWGNVGFSADSSIILPSEINSVKINSWIGPNGTPVAPGTAQAILHAAEVVINATDVAQDVTKILNATVSSSTVVENRNIRVTFKQGTTNISLSGAVQAGSGGLAAIRLNLTTDVVDTTGAPVVLTDVPVVYSVADKTLKFDDWAQVGDNKYGATIVNGALRLANGTTYTVSNGGLAVSASDLGLWKGDNGVSPIVVTFGGTLSSLKDDQKATLAAQLNGEDCGFTIGANRALAEAINAAQATITGETTVPNLVQKAQNYVWTNGNGYRDSKGVLNANGLGKGDNSITKHSGSISKPDKFQTDADSILDMYSNAYIVPYLVINVTDHNQNGTLTATLTPYYRVDVSDSTYDPNEYYTVQAGRPMSALTGDMTTPVQVSFKLTGTGFTANSYMHQDGQYVYKPEVDTGVQTWAINHAGANGTLGTIQINNKVGPITLTSNIANRVPALPAAGTCTYDTLQAAVDDTVPGTYAGGAVATCDTITVDSAYKGSCTVNMTGLARTIKVQFRGNHDVVTGQGSTDVKSSDGFNYTIQLTKDVVTGGNISVTVASATNGTASASATRVKAGDTVTITTVPAAGFSTLGVSAVGNNNTTISVSGAGNSWSFKVPSNVTSITVTPTFGVAGQATVNVNNNNVNGTATVGSSTVTQGSTVTVYTVPKAGYRATGVSVSFSNGTTVSATSTGTNTWSFTVPAGVTTVSVTPSFGVDTGLPFLDVAPDNFYLQYVKFVYKHGMMQGDGSTTYFNGNGNVTRAQLVLILYRLSNSPDVSPYTSFKDVPADQWYSKAVAWASANKIVEGRPGNVFDPGTAVTRQEFATILYRYNTFRGLGSGNLSNLSQFTDRGYVDKYATTAMQWAVGNGIISGTTPSTLSPNGTAIRYQAAAMLTRYCQNFLKMS